MNKKILALLIAAPIVLIFLWVLIVADPRKQSLDRLYFKQLGLELAGKVVRLETVGNGSGIITLKIDRSNKEYLSPVRGEKYYCIIRDGYAGIVEGGISDLQPGDSVVVSCQRDSVFFYRRQHLLNKMQLWLRNDAPFYQQEYWAMIQRVMR